jgi:predicted Zn-dependent peptidase
MKQAHHLIHTLSNGLTILGEPKESAQSAAVGFFVRTGARDETPSESGVSHFLEHMLFKGTPKRSSLDITFAMGKIGAQANAFTSEENTVYYGAVLPEYFSAMQEILSDMMRPSLDPDEFAMEKKVIIEEIALYQDKPHFYLAEHALKDFFGAHTAGNSVLGSTESITALTRDQMAHYFSRRYAPNNIVLAASGKFSWDSFIRDAEALCGSWQPYEAPRVLSPFTYTPVVREYRKKDIKQVHVILGVPGPGAQDEERYPLTLLSMMLGDGGGSRAYWDLVNSGIAESASVDTDERDGVGGIFASASTEPERLDEVVSRLRAIIQTPLEFSEQDLERVKNKLAAKIVLGGELSMGRLMAMGLEWQYRKEVTPLRETVARIRAVTRSDIEKAVAKFPFDGWSEFRLLPE